MPKPTRIPILSFFTGLGLLDLGFHESGGFGSIWHNEANPAFAEGFTYAMRSYKLAPAPINPLSIIDLSPANIAAEAFAGSPPPDCFGVIGGPPCPDFSVGGKNRGAEGDRGQLSSVYAERIIALKPTFFLFENVPGLLRTRKHRLFLTELMTSLHKHYCLDLHVVNALEYGVPQDRERVILVGLLRTRIGAKRRSCLDAQSTPPLLIERAQQRFSSCASWMQWNFAKRYDNPKDAYPWPTTSPYGTIPPRPDTLPSDLVVEPLICDQRALAKLENHDDQFRAFSSRFTSVAEGDVSRKCFKRLHRWRYSPAAAYGNNEVHLHPTEPRRLSVREALRIQTAPDTFALPAHMTLSAKYKTIGNAVPMKLATALATSILASLRAEGVTD